MQRNKGQGVRNIERSDGGLGRDDDEQTFGGKQRQNLCCADC